MSWKKIEKDNLSELILETVGEDRELADRWYKEYTRWVKYTMFITTMCMCIIGGMLFVLVGCFSLFNIGDKSYDMGRFTIGIMLLISGGIMGSWLVITKDDLLTKLKKKKDNLGES